MKRTSKGKKSSDKQEIRNGAGKFTFPNGDSYEGEYIVINNKEIYRHGYGVYKTSEHDEYRALWERDCISSNFHIIYGNKAEYNGDIDHEGAMCGRGTYVFPDGTDLSASWKDNEPTGELVYKDPLEHKWLGKLSLNNEEVVFSPENNI